MKTFVTIAILVVVCTAGHPVQAQAQSGHVNIGFTSISGVGILGRPSLSCLGLPGMDFAEAESLAGWAQVSLDGRGRLHVAARGTFAWALYPRVDESTITGPYDTQHVRLYFGATDINFRLIVDPYTPGTTWTYTIPSLAVSGVNGTFTLVPNSADPGSILGLHFSDSQVGRGGEGIGDGAGQPVCQTTP